MLRSIFLLIPLFSLLAACDAGTQMAATQDADQAQIHESEPQKVLYQCDGTLTLAVVFSNEHAQVTLPDGDVIDLPIAVSGSGFRYATPRHELRGKGDEATWTIGRRMPIQCRVKDE